MASVSFGGDPESYMDPPRMQTGNGGGGSGSFFAKVFDLLGINRQVAKGPKADSKKSKKLAEAGAKDAKIPVKIPSIDSGPGVLDTAPAQFSILNEMESAFKPIAPLPADWGQRYLESLKPIHRDVDPNKFL